MKSRKFNVTVAAVLMFTLLGQSASHAASRSQIESYYKKIYRQMANTGNTLAIEAMTYYDVEIKQAIGKVLDGKVKCDTASKNRYKAIAYNTSQSEVNQLVNGFYLGYCNAR